MVVDSQQTQEFSLTKFVDASVSIHISLWQGIYTYNIRSNDFRR